MQNFFSEERGARTLKKERKEKQVGFFEIVGFAWGGGGRDILELCPVRFPRKKALHL